MNCPFCSFISGRDRRVGVAYQDEMVLVMMSPGQANPGHLLIMPKQHIERLSEMPEEVAAHLFKIAVRMRRAIEASGIRCEGSYLSAAEGEGSFQMDGHFYLELVPRFRRDRYYVRAIIDRPHADPDSLLRKLFEDRRRRSLDDGSYEGGIETTQEELDELAASIRRSYEAIWGSAT
jgi:histidine triad (HIT) family protein